MSTTKGANNNVEDILASIRSSISDEGGFRVHQGNAQAVPLRREIPVAEEAAEFELPSIFKPAPPQPVKPNILGRLSEALKSTSDNEMDRSRTVVRFEPAGGHRMIEPPASGKPAVAPASITPIQRLPEPEEMAEKAQHANDGVAREMASFFDTRLNRMGELSRQSAPQAPMPMSMPMQPEPLPDPRLAVASFPPADTAFPPPTPPRLPSVGVMDAGTGDPIEDAAALLLRPMLKQWLSENMPKIVERALRNESELGGQQPQVPQQQQPQPPYPGPTFEVRKTLR